MSAPPAPGARRRVRPGAFALLVLPLLALAALQLAPWITWTPEQLARHGLLIDDAYFYSVLAENLGRFGFLTLDGEMPTNGVQPLWMLLQIGLTKIAAGTEALKLLIHSSWITYLLACLLALRLVLDGLRRRSLRERLVGVAVLCGVLLLNVQFQGLVVRGLETPLALVALLLTAIALRGAMERVAGGRAGGENVGLSCGRLLGLALVAMLCFFARTDLFWVPLVIGVWLLRARGVRAGQRILYGAVAALLAAPYLIFNLVTQGGLMPISGRVKMFYSQDFFPTLGAYLRSEEWTGLLHALGRPFPWLTEGTPVAILLCWALLLIGAALWLLHRRQRRDPTLAALRLIGGALLGHTLVMQLVYRVLQPRTAYYFAPELLWLGLLLALGLAGAGAAGRSAGARPSGGARRWRALRGRGDWLGPAVGLLALGLLVATSATRRLAPDPYWERRLALAAEIDRLVPPGERVAAFWPGLFAHFCDHRVTPLDGVIGSREYFERYVRPKRELDYLLERGRPYLALLLPVRASDPERTGVEWGVAFHKAPPHWTRVGAKRIWDRQAQLQITLLAAQVMDEQEGVWCLLAIEPLATQESGGP